MLVTGQTSSTWRRMGCAFYERVRKLNTLEEGDGQHLKERCKGGGGEKEESGQRKLKLRATYRDCITE